MSYNAIKNYIVRRMNGLGYQESQGKFDFQSESDINFDKAFIVTRPQGQIADGNTLATTFYPTGTYSVRIAWQISENGIYEYDIINIGIDEIIADLHDPANFTVDSIKNFQYQSHSLKEEKNYLLAEILFEGTSSLSF